MTCCEQKLGDSGKEKLPLKGKNPPADGWSDAIKTG